MRIFRVFLIVLVFLFAAGLVWLQFNHVLFYRRAVLDVPIRFEEGFSLNREFTVDTSQTYWVAIQYDEVFRITIEVPVPQDEFAAKFEVISKDQVIAKGSTASYLPDWKNGGPAPWASNRNQITRYLDSFHAERGKKYSLSLQITQLLPRLVGKNPRAMVFLDGRFDEFYQLREILLISVGAVIGILILIERGLTRILRK